jgi:hypothetical protein
MIHLEDQKGNRKHKKKSKMMLSSFKILLKIVLKNSKSRKAQDRKEDNKTNFNCMRSRINYNCQEKLNCNRLISSKNKEIPTLIYSLSTSIALFHFI